MHASPDGELPTSRGHQARLDHASLRELKSELLELWGSAHSTNPPGLTAHLVAVHQLQSPSSPGSTRWLLLFPRGFQAPCLPAGWESTLQVLGSRHPWSRPTCRPASAAGMPPPSIQPDKVSCGCDRGQAQGPLHKHVMGIPQPHPKEASLQESR